MKIADFVTWKGLHSSQMKHVIIIGSGIIGLTTAYEFATRGYSVAVIDKERYPASKCSYANGGQNSVSNSETWTTFANVKKGIKWMFKKDAPLYIKPTLEWRKIKWLMKFLYHTIRGSYVHNTIKTIRLGKKSQVLYNQMIEREGIEFDRINGGILHFYRDEEYFNQAKEAKKIYDDLGIDWSLVTHRVKDGDLDPALDLEDVVGAYYTDTDWTGDIHKFCMKLRDVLVNKYHVSFIHRYDVKDLNDYKGSYPVIVCAGVGSEELANSVGETLDIYPVKGYSITINNCDPKLLPKVSLLDDQTKVVTATLGNRFRVAGTAELTGENYDITRSRIEPLLEWVRVNFPLIDCSDYSQWACLRPMTPDMMPVVRASKKKATVYYNTGHGHLGWTLAPATAKEIADIVDREYFE